MKARSSGASAPARRGARAALWQDATAFQDSFFAPDTRDGFSNSGFGSLADAADASPQRSRDNSVMDDVAGVVVDARYSSFSSRH